MLAQLVSFLCLLLPQGQEHLVVRGPTPALLRLGSTAVLSIDLIDPQTRPNRIGLPEVAGLSMRAGGWSENSSMSVINGRVKREYKFSTKISISPEREGRFTIPEFEVIAGKQHHRIEARTLEVVRELDGQERSFLEVRLSSKQVYINKPLRVYLQYGVDNRLRLDQQRTRSGDAYYSVELKAPWLDDMAGTVSLKSTAEPEQALNLVLNGHLQQVDYQEDFVRKGLHFHRFSLVKSFMPTKVGKIQLPPVILNFQSEIGERRTDFFGRRIGGETKDFFNYSEPLEVEVLPLPEEGQPLDFSKAVGRFKIHAAADRHQVRVGNSVKLTLTIEGQGNSEFLEVPSLDAVEGFHLLGSKIDRELAGVTATYDLTPLSASVTSLPGIDLNYFDSSPGVERYVSVSTEPIPLEVLPLEEGKTLAALPGEESKPVIPGVDDIFDIKPNVGEPLPLAPLPGRGTLLGLLAGPWIACGMLALFLAMRRRRAGDVAGRRARCALREFRRDLAAGREPADALVAYLAARLGLPEAAVIGPDLAARLQQAGVDEGLAGDAAAATESGVAARYGGTAVLDAAQAEALTLRLEAVRIVSRKSAQVLAGVFLLLSLACAATAQDQGALSADDARAAYRRGDYAAAEQGFASALAAPSADRRLAYNLGNALYRQGELARALVAYERARLAMPRDPELLANIALVHRQLELGSAEGEPFLEAVAHLRDAFTRRELLWIALATNLLAAAFSIFARSYLRWVGGLLFLGALVLSTELLLLGPARAPCAIITADQAMVYAEPRESPDLEPVLTLRGGVQVGVLAMGPKWVKVQVGERSGYLRSEAIEIVQ